MKNSLKIIAKLILSWIVSFLVIYLFVFFGGYKLFQSGDIILKEIGVSFIVGFIFVCFLSFLKVTEIKIDKLEKRVEELEKTNNRS